MSVMDVDSSAPSPEVDEQVAKQVHKHLLKRVALDKTPITYRQLAREAGLTTEQAKRQMQLYLENADAKTRGVDATYLVSGAPLKSGASGTDATKMDVDEPSISTAATSSSSSQMPDWCVKLVKCQELQTALEAFEPDTVKSHVYSLANAPLIDLGILSLNDAALSNADAEARKKWKALPDGTQTYGQIVLDNPAGLVKGGSSSAPAASTSKSASTSSSKVPPAKGKSTSAESSASTATATEDKKKSSEAKPQAKNPFAMAASNSKKKELPPIGQLGGFFAKQSAPPPAASSSSSKKKSASAESSKGKKAAPAKPVVKKPAAAQDEEEDYGLGFDDDWAEDERVMREIEEQETRQSAPKEQVQKTKKKAGGKHVTKTRTVKRKIKAKNDKGYTVTKTVEEEEEYTETESE